MGKWLLTCLQMAISAGSTQVCHRMALVDVVIFFRISRTNFTGCVYDVEFTVVYRNEPKTEMWARIAQLVEYQTCMQGIVDSIHVLTKWLFRPIYLCYLLIVDVQDKLIKKTDSN